MNVHVATTQYPPKFMLHANEQRSSILWSLSRYNKYFHEIDHREKSNFVKSGDHGGHKIEIPRQIQWSEYASYEQEHRNMTEPDHEPPCIITHLSSLSLLLS
ncbi:hypothetical protein TNCV_703821 [Trichonephila clavipes]|nr:hypothetical protein TNCV_703821 [Trichonephila clavipes]